jgi:hypothetical protein
LTVALPRLRVPETSIARMPPVDPSQAAAVRVEPSVAELYCGTRTTWNFRWPWVVSLAAAFR